MHLVTSPAVVGVTGGSGATAARLLIEERPCPLHVIFSRWGRMVFEREAGRVEDLVSEDVRIHDGEDLDSPLASGSNVSRGMIIVPCSMNTLGKLACGISDNLVTRAAAVHLKERRPLILAIRETPMTVIDLRNAARLAEAGAVVFPLTPPFYQAEDTVEDLFRRMAGRLWSMLGGSPPEGYRRDLFRF